VTPDRLDGPSGGPTPAVGECGSHLPDLWRLGPAEVISVVGGGGKSTLLELLARQYEAEGRRVILTTTTRMWPPGQEAGARPLVTAPDLPTLLERLCEAPERSPVVGRSVLADGKLEDVPPDWVPALRDLGWVEAVVVEADGSAGRPLKAPAAWEPVVPACSTLLVVMAGLDCQGVPLDGRHMHRPELLAALLGVSVGAALPDDAPLRASLLGYARAVPRHARLLVLLNKADAYPPRPGLLRAAAVDGLWSQGGGPAAGVPDEVAAGVDVWWGAAGAEPPAFRCLRPGRRRLNVAIAAAGKATRMGGSKVLSVLGGETLLERTLATARQIADVGGKVVVVRVEDEDEVRRLTGGTGGAGAGGGTASPHWGGAMGWVEAAPEFCVVVNREPERGMASSLALAAEAVGSGDLLVLLADQPFAGEETVGRLRTALEAHPRAAAAVLVSGGNWGPPLVIGRSLAARLPGLLGDRGARAMLEAFEDRMVRVAAEWDEALDVDTPADLEKARRLLS
jgi:probable selenium-dependent hydroxylase accessory protein YqeC